MEKLTHKDLVEIGYKWVMSRCGVAFKELNAATGNGEIPDVIGFNSGESFLIECKATRNDFLSDKKKSFRMRPETGMGKFRFYLCRKGLITLGDLPENWGLIYVNENGKAKCVYNPYGRGNIYSNWNCFQRDILAEQRLMYSALRRLQLRGRINEIYDKL